MTEMKKPTTRKLTKSQYACIALSATVLGTAALTTALVQPAHAVKDLKNLSAPLLDPALESALKNHFQKRFFNLIEASKEQEKEISEILDKQLIYSRPKRERIKEELLDIANMLKDQSVSPEQIKSKLGEIKEIRKEIQDRRIDCLLEIRELLNAEQKEIVSAKLQSILTGNPRLELLSR